MGAYTTILGEGTRKSRKKHQCCKCDCVIPAGVLVNWQTNTGGYDDDAGDFDFGTAYWCHPECKDPRKEEW